MFKRYINWVATTKWPQTKYNRTLAASEPRAFARHVLWDFAAATTMYCFMKYQQKKMKRKHEARVISNIQFQNKGMFAREQAEYKLGLNDGANTLYDQIRADNSTHPGIVTAAAGAMEQVLRTLNGDITTERLPNPNYRRT